MAVFLYTWLLRLTLPLILLRLLYRGFGNTDYWHRWPERFGFVEKATSDQPIWLHAVSVGEVRAAVPLVQKLQAKYPNMGIHITTMTPTGSAQVRQLFGTKVSHCYIPYDYPSAIRRFLRRIKPRILITMETELWPNIFINCHNFSIPIIVANARLSERSMHSYARHPNITKYTLDCITMIAAQTDQDAERIISIGASTDKVHITGSIKFDIEIPEAAIAKGNELRRHWGEDRSIWVAASTHENEEQQVLKAFKKLKAKIPSLLLVLVPRHPERFDKVYKLCNQSGYRVARHSTKEEVTPATDIVLGDTMGELQTFYVAADVAFVGGSLVPVGGHNPLEAYAVSVPVVFGPHMFNFSDIADISVQSGAAQLTNAAELPDDLLSFLANKEKLHISGIKAKELLESNRGAIDRLIELVSKVIK